MDNTRHGRLFAYGGAGYCDSGTVDQDLPTRHYPPADWGPWLRSVRLELGLSLPQAARRAGISAGFLCQLEQSQRCPSWSTADMIRDAYGIGGDELDRLFSVAVVGRGTGDRAHGRRDHPAAGRCEHAQAVRRVSRLVRRLGEVSHENLSAGTT
jgi:transcriptional regulator with XRE-family HTH domain